MKQKHMTKEMRERIEKGIREGESLKEIAKAIDKDPTTISKEVLKHRSECVPEYNFNEKPSPCTKCEKYHDLVEVTLNMTIGKREYLRIRKMGW